MASPAHTRTSATSAPLKMCPLALEFCTRRVPYRWCRAISALVWAPQGSDSDIQDSKAKLGSKIGFKSKKAKAFWKGSLQALEARILYLGVFAWVIYVASGFVMYKTAVTHALQMDWSIAAVWAVFAMIGAWMAFVHVKASSHLRHPLPSISPPAVHRSDKLIYIYTT